MNLRSIANGMTRRVKSNKTVVWRRNVGWDQDPVTFKRTPKYQSIVLSANIQPVSSTDLEFVDGINKQGYSRAVYLNARAMGQLRSELRGGDLFTFCGQEWLVTQVPEDWDENGWCRVIVTRQDKCCPTS
ncbi:hypothetical protein [Acetobacter pasteurianus]|uniref:Phage protein n=1 Tax=Acetobacter pasteurianus subsp. pasteurianus TaxID=481145 RepID=A0A1Y0Y6S5_ACEPA|nr:hypothetical protein [Acetobacter pasteurianus]ARW48144.1 hypothetical protein S1001342_01821 [Acetobacter pasteurianus subsp. pasteurianus]